MKSIVENNLNGTRCTHQLGMKKLLQVSSKKSSQGPTFLIPYPTHFDDML